MNFGSPPTDNLYKFISIFGLVLLGAIVFYMYRLERDYKVESINLELQSGLLLSQMKMFGGELENTTKNISIMDAEIEALNKSKLPKNDYNAYTEKFNSIISKRELEVGKSESFQKRLQEHEEKRLKIEYDHKILSMNSEEKANFEKTGKIGIYISVILILSGFCLWYIKLQIYQDAILRKQANTLNNEIDYPSLPITSNKPATSDSLHNEEQNEKNSSA